MSNKNTQSLKGNLSTGGAIKGSTNVSTVVKIPGIDGATFTPSVDEHGNLTWTNDAGLDNPESVNIRGPQGIQGPKGDKGDNGETGPQGIQGEKGDPFIYDDFTAEQLAALKGERGPKGDQGERGIQGIQGLRGPQGFEGERADIIDLL